jgi:hypothetical protein
LCCTLCHRRLGCPTHHVWCIHGTSRHPEDRKLRKLKGSEQTISSMNDLFRWTQDNLISWYLHIIWAVLLNCSWYL